MKHLLLYAIFSFLIFSCQDDVRRDVKNYSFKDEAKINTDSLGKYLVDKGNKRVFEYRLDISSKNKSLNHRLSFGLRFEMDSSQIQFSLKDDQLKAALTHYFHYNEVSKDSFSPINKGSIKGKQVAEGLWELEMDVEIQHVQVARIKEKALFVRN